MLNPGAASLMGQASTSPGQRLPLAAPCHFILLQSYPKRTVSLLEIMAGPVSPSAKPWYALDIPQHQPFLIQSLHILHPHAKDEEVFFACLLSHLHVGPIHGTNSEGPIHHELHVAGTRGLCASCGDLLGEICCRDHCRVQERQESVNPW